MKELEKEFHTKMTEIYDKAKAEIGYNAGRFKQLVDTNGGLKAAKILLAEKVAPLGFVELSSFHHRPDLTMEALIVENSKFYELFTKDEIKVAKKRLRDVKYIPKMKY